MHYRNDLIRSEQAKRDWSNQKLSWAANVSDATVTAVRRGDANVAYMSLVKIATALGLTMWQLHAPDAPLETFAPTALAPSPELGRVA
jgi:ribosome-binding protein aMBF1 (putative translation factor)